VPHDAAVRDYGSGLSRVEIARNMRIDFTVLPKLIGRSWFDEVKCEKGVRALENYRREWNESMGCFRDHPRHDSASHASDSFRYLAISLKKAKTREDDARDYTVFKIAERKKDAA
jgi:phage terminase large subunit